MKGTLRKTLGIWAVHYTETGGDEQHGHSTTMYKNVSPHPDDFKFLVGNNMEGLEVEFEIYLAGKNKSEYAKIIFPMVEKSESWSDILIMINNFKSTKPHKNDLISWLEEHYYSPVKKKK